MFCPFSFLQAIRKMVMSAWMFDFDFTMGIIMQMDIKVNKRFHSYHLNVLLTW